MWEASSPYDLTLHPRAVVRMVAGAHEGESADHFSSCWVCAFWWGGWIKEAVTGLKVRNGKSVKFLWAVDFPSRFQAHFREKTTANRAASLPPGSSSDPPLSSQSHRSTNADFYGIQEPGLPSRPSSHHCELRRESESHPCRDDWATWKEGLFRRNILYSPLKALKPLKLGELKPALN